MISPKSTAPLSTGGLPADIVLQVDLFKLTSATIIALRNLWFLGPSGHRAGRWHRRFCRNASWAAHFTAPRITPIGSVVLP
jgi:hypothetical protein